MSPSDAAFFGCVGTAGQRCTTTRRLIVHESLYDKFLGDLIRRYGNVGRVNLCKFPLRNHSFLIGDCSY